MVQVQDQPGQDRCQDAEQQGKTFEADRKIAADFFIVFGSVKEKIGFVDHHNAVIGVISRYCFPILHIVAIHPDHKLFLSEFDIDDIRP